MMNEEAEETERLSDPKRQGGPTPAAGTPSGTPSNPPPAGNGQQQRVVHNTPTDEEIESQWGVKIRKG